MRTRYVIESGIEINSIGIDHYSDKYTTAIIDLPRLKHIHLPFHYLTSLVQMPISLRSR